MRDYYEILGVPQDARADDIKRAYRRLARRYHPDISGDDRAGAFLDIARAYDVLGDPERRRNYDAQLRPHPSSTRDDWPDDVAIDFPSVAAVLERARDAFFGTGDPVSRLSAQVLLSASEAFWGTTVPLEVPLRWTCHSCGGRGEIWTETCPECMGSGESRHLHALRLSVPAGVRDGARFRFSITPPQAPVTLVEIRIAIR